ncbi:MAG: hypothetical protein JSS66_05140 [Armatimonadetes bacterium]|nr:hypothetical protein [Armatimonadota bacterium]
MDARTKAVRLALLQESDADDFEMCVRDVQANTGLSEQEARVVAGALREELLPKVAESLGLDHEDMAGFHSPMHDDEKSDTTDFADDDQGDEFSMDSHPVKNDMAEDEGDLSDFGDDMNDDTSDAEDLGAAKETLEIHVPADKVEEVEEAIKAILGEGALNFGDEQGLNMADDGEDFTSFGDDEFDNGDEAPEIGKQAMSMSKEQLAERQARRAALLANDGRGVRTASGQVKPKDIGLGSDTSHGGKPFQYAADAQFDGEDKRPGMTLEDSAGNSLRDQNPTFADTMVYTKNPENLQLKNTYKTFKFEGSDGDIEYDMSSEAMQVPSAGEKAGGDFAVPTQMDGVTLDRKTTVAKLLENVERVAETGGNDEGDDTVTASNDDELFVTSSGEAVNREQFEEHVIDTLVASGMDEREVLAMSFAEGLELYEGVLMAREASKKPATMNDIITAHTERQARINKLATELKMEISGGGEDEPEGTDETIEEKLKDSREAMREQFIREADVLKKRIKAAYGVTTRLVLAGIINEGEVDSHVDTWLKDNLSVSSMMKQGNFMLRAAQASNKRTVQAGTDGGNTRTAGVSVNPALVSPNVGNTQEVKERLASIFSVGSVPRAAFDSYMQDSSTGRRDF